MTEILAAAQTVLALAAGLTVARVVRGPALADRMVALDLLLILTAGSLAIESARTGSIDLVPVIIVVALVAFAGTLVVARFIEWRDT